MRYRIVVGDGRQPLRGVVEVEAHSYSITDQGMLVVMGGNGPPHPIVTYAPGAWRSIVDVEGFRTALLPGSVSDESSRIEGPRREDSRRRPTQR